MGGSVTELIDQEVVQKVLVPEHVIAAVEDGFGARFATFNSPRRFSMDLLSGGVLLVMPCCDTAAGKLGIKLVTVTKSASAQSGSVQALYVLMSGSTGQAELIVPANYLTDLRTAAASAVATKYLALPDAHTLGIFGTGRQAWAHLVVLTKVRHFDQVFVCGSTSGRIEGFATRAGMQLGIKVNAVDARTCAAKADVLCTCTTATVPLFEGALLRPGTHLNLVGAFRPGDREVDDVTVQCARVVVDTYDGAFAEAGDLLVPINNGTIAPSHVLADLHELVTGVKQVRKSPQDITLFKSVGCALEDFVTAELIWKQLLLQDNGARQPHS